MGISGLLPLLRSITRRVHLEQLAGQSVAVDAYSWLHKGIYGSCAVDHFHGRFNDSFVEFCMSKVRLLLHYNVKPILVFDGAHLPMKGHQERHRAKSRKENREKAHEMLKAGNNEGAYIHIQKSADVTPQMAWLLIKELRKAGISYVVAPYEADAQMAWLDRVGLVSAIVTEDSDLLLFGCQRVLFKLDRDGYADEICINSLKNATELDLSMFPFSKFRHMCMLSGCDYLPSIHGMGLKTAYKYLSKYRETLRVLQVLRAEMPTKMPIEYESDFAKAEMTFLHQRVYDTIRERLCFLNPLPLDVEEDGQDWSFLGPLINEEHAQGICKGHICPNTLVPFSPIGDHVPPDCQISEAILPFEIHLDRTKEERTITISPMKMNTIAAARVSLKRSFSTDQEDQENRSPFTIRPKSFAFSANPSKLHPIGMPSYSLDNPPRRRLGRTSSQPTASDTKQRSIKEFFRNRSTQ